MLTSADTIHEITDATLTERIAAEAVWLLPGSMTPRFALQHSRAFSAWQVIGIFQTLGGVADPVVCPCCQGEGVHSGAAFADDGDDAAGCSECNELGYLERDTARQVAADLATYDLVRMRLTYG